MNIADKPFYNKNWRNRQYGNYFPNNVHSRESWFNAEWKKEQLGIILEL